MLYFLTSSDKDSVSPSTSVLEGARLEGVWLEGVWLEGLRLEGGWPEGTWGGDASVDLYKELPEVYGFKRGQ